ncbi:galactosylgalactosylxylosylprotein 3-beta-glucuronosyltransferase I [Hyalella azteca]|uniref:Galactosylgalactosylxylosylprotein 3-beta-glucuronosyltransferase n=1 Tax=Hyalella azteca TaxID=294128 RepID=A0A8B7NW38_HYAAZ|nr:galactosylgalactosylxylosylprotein 3-beta-glucuronosyltransferase I [Hyalella azteca]
MASSLKRFIYQNYFMKRINCCLTILAILFVFIMLKGWLREGEDESVEALYAKDPGLCNQNIQSLHLQIRELKAQLLTNGLSVPDTSNLPTIFVITPTYARPNQLAELNRLRNVLLHIPQVWWLLVEDREEKSELVKNFLTHSGVPHTHLHQPTPPEWKVKDKSPRWTKPRGVLQRNAALDWLRKNADPHLPAVVYFADDDNSYSIELFQEMRWTSQVSVWPVGLVGGVMVERPLCLCRQGVEPDQARPMVTGWLVGWKPERPFPTDMAGFAVNLRLLLDNPDASFSLESEIGFMETDFLSRIVTKEELEPKAECCTKVLVWHMNAVNPNLKDEVRLRQLGRQTDIGIDV